MVVDVLLVVAGGLVVAQLVEGQGQEQRAAHDDGGPPVTGRQLDEAHAVGSHAWRDGMRDERGGETMEERDGGARWRLRLRRSRRRLPRRTKRTMDGAGLGN